MQVISTSVKPSKEFLEVIRSRSSPTNIKEVRAFYGLVNQVNRAFCKKGVMEPFRNLLRPGTPFKWTPDLQDKFEQVKVAIVKSLKNGVGTFDKGKKTCLAVEWSKHGIGFFLSVHETMIIDAAKVAGCCYW